MGFPTYDYTLNQYQRDAMRTRGNTHDPTLRLAVSALGLAGESGEVADLIKKIIGHGKAPTIDDITKELGDVLWYLADVAECYGLSLEDVARANIKKLGERYPDGFSHEASNNRKT